MSSFSFNFFDTRRKETTSSDPMKSAPTPILSLQQLPPLAFTTAKEIINNTKVSNALQQVSVPGTDTLFLVRKVVKEANDNAVVDIALKRDVLTGVYEGGFTVWECAIDLIQYFISTLGSTNNNQCWANKTVVEAGCGIGLPAIHALQQGAAQVYFQDLNSEVLVKSTQAAVALNARSEDELRRWCERSTGVETEAGASKGNGGNGGNGARTGKSTDAGSATPLLPAAHFVAGDWDAWETCGSEGVDVILSTDTLYAKPQIIKLTHLIHRLLKRKASATATANSTTLPSPCAYIAAKRYYFGVNGGTYTFEQVVQSMPPVKALEGDFPSSATATPTQLVLTTTLVHSIHDNASNIRDILCVTWKSVNSHKHDDCRE
jgi:predicted nicotinamide N-methyase